MALFGGLSMKLGVLFSGGKDSTYAAWLARDYGHELGCLISMDSENKESFMFHTPSIKKVEAQASAMEIPIIIQKTKGEKEIELKDLEKAIKKAVKEYGVEGVITGAVESVYQASRVQEICNKLGLEVFNPLWQKDQDELIEELIEHKFEIILVGVFAYPLTKEWIGREIDKRFLEEVRVLRDKWGMSVAGEGGEFESFVLNCPLFKKELKVRDIEIKEEGENSVRGEVDLG